MGAVDEEGGQEALPFDAYAGVGEVRIRGDAAIGEEREERFDIERPVPRQEPPEPCLAPFELGPGGIQAVVAHTEDAGVQAARARRPVAAIVDGGEIAGDEVEAIVEIPARLDGRQVIRDGLRAP